MFLTHDECQVHHVGLMYQHHTHVASKLDVMGPGGVNLPGRDCARITIFKQVNEEL